MSDEMWKAIVNELLSRDVVDVDSSTISALHELLVKSLEWCFNPLVTKEIRVESCKKFDELSETVLRLLTRYRVIKVLEGSEPRGFDRDIAKKVVEMLNLFVEIVLRGVRVFEGEVLCRVLKPIPLKNSIATPGYIVSLPLRDAVLLSSLGFVEPITLGLEYK